MCCLQNSPCVSAPCVSCMPDSELRALSSSLHPLVLSTPPVNPSSTDNPCQVHLGYQTEQEQAVQDRNLLPRAWSENSQILRPTLPVSPRSRYILGFLFSFVPVKLTERYSLPAQTWPPPFRLLAIFLKTHSTFTLIMSEVSRQMLGGKPKQNGSRYKHENSAQELEKPPVAS